MSPTSKSSKNRPSQPGLTDIRVSSSRVSCRGLYHKQGKMKREEQKGGIGFTFLFSFHSLPTCLIVAARLAMVPGLWEENLRATAAHCRRTHREGDRTQDGARQGDGRGARSSSRSAREIFLFQRAGKSGSGKTLLVTLSCSSP